uniref:phage holin family protein n=1 Tax=Castellaniella defragrans TaxID=75697 RepID=UPI00333F396A
MSLRRALLDLAAHAAAMAHTRFELFSLEAAEARSALFRHLALALVAAACLFMALLVATLGVVLYFWPTEYRNLALGLLALGYAVIGGILAWRLYTSLAHGAAPFAALAEVLGEDAQALRREPARVPAPEPGTSEEAS